MMNKILNLTISFFLKNKLLFYFQNLFPDMEQYELFLIIQRL